MKCLLFFILSLFTTIGWAQSNDMLSPATTDETLNHHSENKNIGLSDITSDIITFSQLEEVTGVTIANMPELEIISYDLTYFIPEGNSVNIYSGKGEKIPNSLIQEIIASGSNQILIENIIISLKGEVDAAGFRNFYVN